MDEIKYIKIDSIKTKWIDNLLNIYQSNIEYFNLCKAKKIDEDSIEDDIKNIPPLLSNENKKFNIVLLNDTPVAVLDYLMGYPVDNNVFIGLLLIDGDLHREGIGTEIVSNLENSLREKGIKKLKLCVIENNIKALNFWSKNGFIRTGITKTSIGDNIEVDVILMEKSI